MISSESPVEFFSGNESFDISFPVTDSLYLMNSWYRPMDGLPGGNFMNYYYPMTIKMFSHVLPT